MSDDFEPVQKRTVEIIRTSLRHYPASKDRLPMLILKSFALTLEVFLHKLIGERYLTWPRFLIGLIALWALAHVGLPWELRALNLVVVKIPYPHATFLEVGRPFGIPLWVPFFTKESFEGISMVAFSLSIYLAAAQWRMLEIFIFNRFGVDTHNRSSGEPWGVWDLFYLIFDRLNFRGDLVKQVCEPLLCAGLGIFLFLSAPFRGVAMWLVFGSMALFAKAWLENAARKRLYLDSVANRLDLDATRAQRPDVEDANEEEFSTVPALTSER